MKINPWIKLAIIISLLAIVYLIVQMAHLNFSQITVENFKAKINSFGIWGPTIYIVFYIARPLILFPAAILSASAGVIWGIKGIVYLLIAANLSATAEFFIARYFAREAIENLIKGKVLNIDKAIEKRGFLTVLLIRLIPNVAWDIQNFVLGLTKVRFWDYFWATLIGIIPGSFALVYFGSSFISVLTNPKNFWKIVVAIALLILIYGLQGFLRKRNPSS
jgi:uncharacterized membrane protein YdjX (TVP38/TMEM64 family)